MLTNPMIAKSLGVALGRIEALWPLYESSLDASAPGLVTDTVRVAALATIRVECPAFAPMREAGGPDYYRRMYWENESVRKMLGNRTEQDALTYYGRGTVQLTGYDNYLRCGRAIGHDLVAHPDLALDPQVSSQVFAWTFKKCIAPASALDFVRVRRLINGGTNALRPFLVYIKTLAVQAAMTEVAEAANAQLEQLNAPGETK